MEISRAEDKDPYKSSRLLYIIEAALEYFVSLSVSSVYLAKITAYLGLSDSLTGVLSSFVSLGCGFQLIAIFLANKRPVKRWVTFGHIASQLLFALLFIVPITELSATVKAVLFVAVLLTGHIIHNIINASKIDWYMSLVDNKKRGRFTANKEIVSLLSGMAFSYGFGAMMDSFEAKGDMRSAFLACGLVLFVLMLLHSLTLIFSKERPAEQATEYERVGDSIKGLFKDKNLFKIIFIPVLWNIANYATISFTGTYQTKELAFSMTFVSVVIMIGSFVRAIFSRTMGKFADKYSFSKMLSVCFTIAAVAFGANMFTVPSNGKILYTIYYILCCVAMAGINSATINLIYDYVEPKQRTQALALSQTFAGFSGFLITLVLSPLVVAIQKNGNSILGVSVYAQQVLSAFSFLITIILLIYMRTVVRKIERKDSTSKE